MTFEGGFDQAAVSTDGEHVALNALGVFIEPGVERGGTVAIFSRNGSGWTMRSATAPGTAAEAFYPELLSPDFSQSAFLSERGLTRVLSDTLVAGPVGGPYSVIAHIPGEYTQSTNAAGANAGESDVPAFSNILFQSTDHELLTPGHEREDAEGTKPGRMNLYEWQGEQLRLVNVDSEGRLLNPCGAVLGEGVHEGAAINAVSANGSRIFFTSPEEPGLPSPCLEPALYMRVDSRETVDVSAPEGVSIPPTERGRASFDGASRDGSKVFFTTGTALTPGAGAGYHLYEYNTEAQIGNRLTLIANNVASVERQFINPGVVVSEDGSTVYYQATTVFEEQGHPVFVSGVWRYDTLTGTKSFVAVPSASKFALEPWYVTPRGGFLVFAAYQGVRVAGPRGLPELRTEPRGLDHSELYRYDAADGSVMCVSCGEGEVAPAKGEAVELFNATGLLSSLDRPTSAVSISEDGKRVFFETSAQLVPQDTNKSTTKEENGEGLGAGADVYEWEAYGTEEAPGTFCHVNFGCTHLISTGEDVGPERFLGASTDGNNVFFTSAAQLLPLATPEYTNIYDARVDGGFPPSSSPVECTSCQGVGSAPLQLVTPSSETLVGASNPSGPIIVGPRPGGYKPKPSPPKCKRGLKRSKHGRCVRSVSHRGVGRS
jgi:hypothetical protein